MPIILLSIFILIMSAVFHEYAHGWVANKLGDPTAKNMGRLTLNPLSHLDPVGSVILPLLLIFSNSSFLIAWAKPVPYNPNNLQDRRYGDLKVAIGGPGINFILALFFGLLARLINVPLLLKQELVISFFNRNYNFLLDKMDGSIVVSIFVMAIIAVFINLLLMIFNLIPIPPLDGSKILSTFLSYDWQLKMHRIEPYGIFIVFFLLMTGLFSLIFYPILFLFQLLVGF